MVIPNRINKPIPKIHFPKPAGKYIPPTPQTMHWYHSSLFSFPAVYLSRTFYAFHMQLSAADAFPVQICCLAKQRYGKLRDPNKTVQRNPFRSGNMFIVCNS